MGFGAVIASGDRNELLADHLAGCITEVRVEQSLEDPTRFAVRFQEDLGEGQPLIMNAPELQCEQTIAIAVQAGDAIRCLVRGPITECRGSLLLGGPGSWFEIRGQDRRVEMDRECFRHAWEGRASDAVAAILGAYDFVADVQQTNQVHAERTGTLNQRATDLAFVRRIARRNSLHFWITYDCAVDPLGPDGGRLRIQEHAHVKSSPPRPDGGSASASIGELRLVPTSDLRLRVNVARDQCPNVNAFDLRMNVERPTTFAGTAVDDRSVQEDRTTATDDQPSIRAQGRRLPDLTGRQRRACITSPGSIEEVQSRAVSLLTEAGWFVNATVRTSAHLLGGILLPHEVIEADGLGPIHSGPYQVRAVTHVISAADHFMDVELRRNAIGRG